MEFEIVHGVIMSYEHMDIKWLWTMIHVLILCWGSLPLPRDDPDFLTISK